MACYITETLSTAFTSPLPEMQLFILKFNKDEWAPKLLHHDTGIDSPVNHPWGNIIWFWFILWVYLCTDDFFMIITGCGNGKYLHINEEIFKLGCDVCRPLVDCAWSQGHEVQLCDGLRLPYRDACFDAVLSIAGNVSA